MSLRTAAPDPRTVVHRTIAPPPALALDLEPAPAPPVSGWHVAAGVALVVLGVIIGWAWA